MDFLRQRNASIARACRVSGLARSTYAYRGSRAAADAPVIVRMKEIVSRHRRWGQVRVHNTLKNEGLVVNPKRTERIYRQQGLQLRKRARKKLSRVPRIVRPRASRPNEVWSMDFVFDWLMSRRKLKCLTVIDDFTKQAVGILVDHAISGAEVGRFLESLGEKPDRIRSDNGPEFVSTALIAWFHQQDIEHETITPGKPNENAFIESFNSRFRDECLNEHIFRDLGDARTKIEIWRNDYNELHPHSALGLQSPNAFAAEWRECYPPSNNAT